MANSLTIDNISEQTLTHLQSLAARHGRSVEDEIRQILQQVIEANLPPGDLARSLFGVEHGVDLELPERLPHEPLDLGE